MKILVPVLVAALFCGAVGCEPSTTTDTDDRPVTTPDTTPRGADELPAGVQETPADELPKSGTDDE